MRCETSFFSLTLFQKHLKRFWPMWAVWLAAWTLTIPVPLWQESAWRERDSLLYTAQHFDELISVTGVFIALAAPIVAVAVFFHLFKAPAANFIGALPMRREGVFATAFAAGYVMLTAPLIVVSLITVAVEAALGVLAPGAIFTWLGGCMLQSFFWFSFATLCCVISGNGVAAVCFYAIFNGVVAVMTFLIEQVLGEFLYGFDRFGDGLWRGVMWLTPIYQASLSNDFLEKSLLVSRFEALWAYAAVGFLMMLAALGLHHIRKAERAGDLIAFGPIRWVFRISVTLCGGLAFGMLLMSLIFWSSEGAAGARLAGCCAVAAVISWFAAEMLLQKSFKVFRTHWKGAAVGALCFVLAISAIDMDWIGFTRRVPRPEQVKSATATFNGSVDPIASEGLTYDAQTVTDLIALHQYLVDHQSDNDGDNGPGARYCSLELAYDLGLTELRRSYGFYYTQKSPLTELTPAAQAAGLPDLDMDAGNPVMGEVYLDLSDDEPNWYQDLTPAQAEAAWTAIREDFQAGRYRADDPEGEWTDRIELSWMDEDGRSSHWQTFYPREGTTSINAFLDKIAAQMKGEDQEALAPASESYEVPTTIG